MATELATAYISLIPELKGAGKSIASQLGGVDVAPTGRKLGKSLSDGISSGIDSSGIRQLENAVASASQKVGRAMASEKDATNQLKIAQQRLVEVRSKYAEGSSQVMAAEAKVESAQRKAASASERTKSAQVELKRAQEQLSSANKKVSSSSADASRGIASMGKTAGSIKGTLSTLAKVAGPALAAIGFSQLVGEAAAATDATQKFKSTLEFAGKADEVERLTASTRKYADETVYDLSDIQNITAQLAANSVKDYDKLAEAAGNLNAVAGGNAETFSSVGMVLTQTAGAGKLTTENWNQLADAIPGASGKLQEAMLKNGAYTGNFRDAMEKGEITAAEFNDAIMQLGFEDAAVEAAKSTATFEGAFGNLQAAAVGGLSDALATIQPLVTGAINGITPLVEGAFAVVNGAVAAFMGGVEAAGSYFAPFIQDIAAIVQANLPVIQAVWEGAMSGIKVVTETVWPLVDAVIQATMGAIKAVVETVLALISGDWDGAWSGIKALTAAVFSGIGNIVDVGISTVQSLISGALDVIDGLWRGAWNALGGLLNAAWNDFISIVSGGNERVMGLLRDLPGKITGVFAGAGSWLINAGKSIINGLLDGLKGAWGNVTGFIGGIGDWIVSHKGPPSYDAVMLTKNGELIMRSLLDGLTTGWGDVEDFIGSRNADISARYAVSSAVSPAHAPAGVGATYNVYLDGRALHVDDRVADAMERFVDVVVASYE